MKSPLSILLDLPGGRRGFCLSLFSALARAVGIVLIAEALVRTIVGTTPVAVWAVLGLLGATLRGASLWADHSLGTTLAAKNKQRLRSSILRSLLRGRGQPRMNTAVTVTRGIDDLDDYFTTVVPALSAAAVVPVTLLVRIVFTDVLSAFIIAVCLPLVPVFMILIGRFTEESTRASNTALERLSDHLAELAEGLPVLIGLGRSRDHARTLRALGEKYHSANLATLRIAFLSSLALELIATISVALVAVVIGLRLVSGTMDLSQGLFVLLLAPECFIPLRELGAGYHASENGRDAQERAHSLIASTEAASAEVASAEVASTEVASAEGPAFEAAHSHSHSHSPRHRVAYANGTTISWAGDVPSHPGVTVIRGDSGAGKTTILMALAGNLPARAGTTMTPHRVAFVPQAPRIFAATIGAELAAYGLVRSRQQQALEAACLPVDPEQSTSALSPGQLRRLAFVRVLHRIDDDVETLLLDEPTAHLDDENAEIVITMIAEAAGRVRIVLASHDVRVTALADDEIIPSKTTSGLSSNVATGEATGEYGQPQTTSAGPASRGSAVSARQLSAQAAAEDASAAAEDGAGEAPPAEPMPDERSSTPVDRWSELARRWSILRSSLPLLNRDMIIALLSACGASLAAIALTAVSAWLIVEASYRPPIMILMVAIVGVRFFGLSRSVLLYLSRLKLHSAIFGSLGRLRSRLWEHFETVGMGDRKLLTSDSALRSMVSDADDVRDLIPRTLFPPIVALMVFSAVLIATWVLDPHTLPLFLALGALNLGVLSAVVIRSEGRLAQRTRMGRDRILSLLVRALNAKTDLRTNRADNDVLSVLGHEEGKLELAQQSSSRNFGVSHVWLQLTTVGAALLIAVTSSAPTEILAVLVLMALGLMDVFSQSLSALRQLPALGVVLDRLPDMSPAPAGASLAGDADTAVDGEAAPLAALELGQITVGWDARAVIEDLDLRAERGRWTVLTGDSGSGKSTTLSVLLRFLDPWSGTYRAEDDEGRATDMLGLAPSDLAGRVAWCPQEAHVFRSTVRGNLAIARPDAPTAEEMYAALTSAGLEEWADPDGLELWVGDHGTDISGGQRQRLAVARTLLSGAEVIVLDEPTAHLDAGLAHRLVTDLRTNLDSHTVVMVTHDHSLIAAGDRVVDLGSRISPASSRT